MVHSAVWHRAALDCRINSSVTRFTTLGIVVAAIWRSTDLMVMAQPRRAVGAIDTDGRTALFFGEEKAWRLNVLHLWALASGL